MISALLIAIAAIVVIYIFRPLFGNHGQIRPRHGGRTGKLLEDRELLYDTIRELDFDYRMGKVEEDDYQAARSRYQTRAVELMKTIDQINGQSETSEQKIEQEIAALRGSQNRKKGKKNSCSNCGASAPSNARFCPQCGKAI